LNGIYIGNNIRVLRKKNGMTQLEVAERLGVVHTTVGGYERGKSFPSFEQLIALQKILKVNLHDFVYTDLSVHPSGLTESQEKDERTERIITRLNIELDKKAEEIISRADPEDLEKLKALRAEYIDKYPGIAKKLGIRK
jgi:transcriptional regulator with XRE-family HTH domain